MKYIVKQSSPQAFEDWKNQETPKSWDNDFHSNLPKNQEEGVFYYSKSQLRKQLLEEQGFICCYCQQEIQDDFHTPIEHIKPRELFKELTFDYKNLLASCDGGQKERRATKPFPAFCDAKKGKQHIEISPLYPNCEQHFDYKIIETTADIEIEVVGNTIEGRKVIEQLNLNVPFLRRLRATKLRSFLDETLSEEDLTMILLHYQKQIETKPNNKFPPFCIVVINILEKLIKNKV